MPESMKTERVLPVPATLIQRTLDYLDPEVTGAYWVARDLQKILSSEANVEDLNHKRRIRPWRCTVCSDRFAHEQDPALGHRTVYEPREWERR